MEKEMLVCMFIQTIKQYNVNLHSSIELFYEGECDSFRVRTGDGVRSYGLCNDVTL